MEFKVSIHVAKEKKILNDLSTSLSLTWQGLGMASKGTSMRDQQSVREQRILHLHTEYSRMDAKSNNTEYVVPL